MMMRRNHRAASTLRPDPPSREPLTLRRRKDRWALFSTCGRHPHIVASLLLACCLLLLVLVPDRNAKALESESFGIAEASDAAAERPSNQSNSSTLGPLSIAEQTEWIQNHFRAADPNEQDWCTRALIEGTFWKSPTLKGGAQFSQDVFLARNLFFERYVRSSTKGYYVEAGANHYKSISSTYFYDKCLGWDGLCVEPQRQYHADLQNHRACTLVPMCLTKERTDDMMVGGMPPHRGGGMFIRPLPEDGKLPNDGKHWEQISCAPLAEILNQYARNDTKHHIDLFVLDVEGAELPVLDTIDWGNITFTVLQIETNKLGPVQEKLKGDMFRRGYELAYSLETDSIFVSKGDVEAGSLPARDKLWEPSDGILGMKG